MKIERIDRVNSTLHGWTWEPSESEQSFSRLTQATGASRMDVIAALEHGETLTTCFADYRKAKSE